MTRVVTAVLLALCLAVSCTASGGTYDASRVHKATVDEVYNFLVSDKTDEKQPSEHYDCSNFAADLWWAAYQAGVDAAIAIVDDPKDSEHALVIFYIEYEWQWVLVEPQTDNPMSADWVDILATYQGKEAFKFWKDVNG